VSRGLLSLSFVARESLLFLLLGKREDMVRCGSEKTSRDATYAGGEVCWMGRKLTQSDESKGCLGLCP
jgi:hypothetical protein